MLFQFLVSVYGGYFGAGIGILMLAAFGIMGFTDIHQMNGLKNFLALCINGVAAVYFIWNGMVSWPHALVMAVGRDRRRRLGRRRRPPHRPEGRPPHRHHRRLHDGALAAVPAVKSAQPPSVYVVVTYAVRVRDVHPAYWWPMDEPPL